MLTIENIDKTYKKNNLKALSDVSFKIDKGDFAALLGANGAGKTTLLNILTGVVAADAGEIKLDGQTLIKGNRLLKKRIGIVPQELVFDYIFSVEETLKLYAGYYGILNADTHIEYLLERLSLTEKRKVTARSLSGGMKRRLLIARALVHKPDILLLDEPTAGVDISLRQEMYNFLNELHQSGTTIILTTHYLEEAENLCSRILMLKDGELIADTGKSEFLRTGGNNVNIDLSFYSENDLKLFGLYDHLSFDENNLLHASLSIDNSEMQSIFYHLSQLENGVKEIRINPPKLEDVFLQLSETGERK